ncbi:hypothetical protein ACWKSP_13765 [Micromonosporaceae bacterium Da 78-11]
MRAQNPYLVLGVPFGTGRAEANAAFAARNKALPADPAEARTRRTDLTRALQQIDQGPPHPEAELTIYRIPADPAPVGTGVFAPPPEEGPISDEAVAAALRRVRAAAAHEHLIMLLIHHGSRIRPPAP